MYALHFILFFVSLCYLENLYQFSHVFVITFIYTVEIKHYYSIEKKGKSVRLNIKIFWTIVESRSSNLILYKLASIQTSDVHRIQCTCYLIGAWHFDWNRFVFRAFSQPRLLHRICKQCIKTTSSRTITIKNILAAWTPSWF